MEIIMSIVTGSSKLVKPRRLHLAALVLSWGAFAFFTINQLLHKETSSQDAEKVQELESLTLTPTKHSATDWPGWRGPNRDGVSAETGLLTTWPEGGPRKLWEAPAGEGFSSMAIAGGRVYSMVQDQVQEAVVCWDQDTGRELWRHR